MYICQKKVRLSSRPCISVPDLINVQQRKRHQAIASGRAWLVGLKTVERTPNSPRVETGRVSA